MPKKLKKQLRENKGASRNRPPKLATVKRVSPSSLSIGDVIWGHIPFADGTGEKTRPGIVVGMRGREVTVVPATTSKRCRYYPNAYAEVSQLNGTGLSRHTWVGSNQLTIDIMEIIEICGALATPDRARVGELLDIDLVGAAA